MDEKESYLFAWGVLGALAAIYAGLYFLWAWLLPIFTIAQGA